MSKQAHELFPVDGYCFDSNCFIHFFNKEYGEFHFDIFTDLKGKIEDMVRGGLIICPKQVLEELSHKDDGALDWVKKIGLGQEIDENQLSIASEITKKFPSLIDEKKTTEQADPYVIALAEVKGFTVVSYEKPSLKRGKVNIPDVCKARNVECINFRDFIRKEGIVFNVKKT